MYKTIKCFLFAFVLVYACTAQAYKSSIEEFNEKFPFGGEIIGALEQVNSVIPAESNSLKLFKANFATQLELRAFACYPFQSKEETDPKKIATSNVKLKNCLQEKDEKLLQFIGMSLVGYRLMQEPLRPLTGLGLPSFFPNPVGEILIDGKAASKSNVAVLRFENNESISIEIPSGKKIANLPRYPNKSYETLLSYNGRVITVPYNGLNFIDTESGQVLWRAKEISKIYVWLPEIQAALVRGTVNGVDKLLILDFKKNKVEPYKLLKADSQDWALNISESPSRMLIGNYKGFSQIENVRSTTGVEGKVIKEYKLTKGRIHIKSPILMQGGKSIFIRSSRDGNTFLTLFNLKSGEETQFETDNFLNHDNYAKLSEEEILVTSYQHLNAYPMLWAFNVNKLTLSPVRLSNFEGLVTMLSEQRTSVFRNHESMLEERSGFMYLDEKNIWLGDILEIGKPVSLASLINQHRLETELTALEEKYGNTSVYESKVAKKRAQVIGKIPTNAKVRAIGIIGRANVMAHSFPKIVNVTLKKTKEPIVLLLSSCGNVRWNLVKENGSNLVAVIATTYRYASEVVGVDDTKTINTIRTVLSDECKNYDSYEKGGVGYVALDREAVLWTSKHIDEAQGEREANSFTVGN